MAWCQEKLKENKDYYLYRDMHIMKKGIKVLLKKVGGKEVVIMNYCLFRQVIEQFNLYAGDALIEGEFIQLDDKLGCIHGRRIERSYVNPKIDLARTMQARRVNPAHPAIYYLDEDYCRIGWRKYNRTPNESVYDFTTAAHTMKARFSKALTDNPILKFNYTYYPLIKVRKTA